VRRSSWEKRRLADFAITVSTGPFGSVLHKSDYVDQGVPLVNPINIVNGCIVPDPAKLISQTTKKRLGSYVLQEHDIVVGRRGEIGRCAVVGAAEAGWVCGTGSFFIRPLPSVNSQFLAHLLRSSTYREKLEQLSTGTTMKNLSNSSLGNLMVSLPPFSEQQRIVAILDEAFDGIATAKANTEKNLQNARTLFESQLQSIFNRRDASWVHTGRPLSELCDLIVDCEHKTAPTQEEGIPSIRTPNIGKGVLLLDGVYRVSEETYRLWTRRAEPLPGDLILAREAPAGNVAVIPENTKVCLGQRTVLIRPDRRVFEPEFLALALLQPTMQQKLLDHSRGATVQHVNMKDIRALDLGATPPLSEQRDIVSAVALASQATQRLESIYQQKLAALAELKKSLLHQAFSGAL